jgi:hypothetical protein
VIWGKVTLTIIKNCRYLDVYPFIAIESAIAEEMLACQKRMSIKGAQSAIRLFEAFCYVCEFEVTSKNIGSRKFNKIVKSFLGSLHSDDFVGSVRSVRQEYAKGFVRVLSSLHGFNPDITDITWDPSLPSKLHSYWKAASKRINEGRAEYWCGWAIQTKRNKPVYLPIAKLIPHYGISFAKKIQQQLALYLETQAGTAIQELRDFIDYLSENHQLYNRDTFKDPDLNARLFKNYMLHSFMNCYKKGNDLITKKRTYVKFIGVVERYFFESKVWARPYQGHISAPIGSSKPGTLTRITETNGVAVKNKLLTLVPLQITDTQAFQLLFTKITEDIDTVVRWARCECRKQGHALKRRIKLSREGILLPSDAKIYSSVEQTPIEHLCATLCIAGYNGLRNILDSTYHRHEFRRQALARELAIPNYNDFYAFHYLLIHGHPCITASFLNGFELYDKTGKLVGFTKVQGQYQLLGYKDRKGAGRSEQLITLTPREAVLVRQIIQLTDPLRAALRAEKNDSWRYLFLHGQLALGRPARCEFSKWDSAKLSGPRCFVVAQFEQHSKLKGIDLFNFVLRVSPSSFRSSCAVAIYLETQSTEAMAKALGHTYYTSTLLSHYLPESIQQFFQSRWIRIFQKGILCEAMKDSPYLFQASGFCSIEDMHEFLKNHAIRDIPTHLEDPEGTTSTIPTESQGQLLISVDKWILTTLLSLRAAVDGAHEKLRINALSKYWSKVTTLIEREIERTRDSTLIDHLKGARLLIEPSRMEKLIYESTS